MPKKNALGLTPLQFKPVNLGMGEYETRRDSRRTFTRTQQNEIWDRQKGKCVGSYCRHKQLLRSATHYDHVIPWEKGGKTIVGNGQALCPTCHAIKGQKDRLKKVDTKREEHGLVKPIKIPVIKIPRIRF